MHHSYISYLIFKKGHFPILPLLMLIIYHSAILYRKSMKFGIQEELLLLSFVVTKFHFFK